MKANQIDWESPKLIIENPQIDPATDEVWKNLIHFIDRQESMKDIRDLRPQVQEMLGPGYLIGTGGSHIWIHTTGPAHTKGSLAEVMGDRLALIVVA